MQRVAALVPGALVIADAPPDTKGADAADWARLTDRRSWESLAAAAVAPGRGWRRCAGGGRRSATEARRAGQRRGCVAHGSGTCATTRCTSTGRGWFIKPPERALWGHDGDGAMLTSVQDHPLYIGQCRKGTSARGIMGRTAGPADRARRRSGH